MAESEGTEAEEPNALESAVMTAEILDAIVAGIDVALPQAAALRREIHTDPHLGGDESETRDTFTAATAWLDWIPVAETGAYAKTADGPAVGIRAELDALPIMEATGVEWASQRRGIMHACGHDVHLAALWAVLHAVESLDLPIALAPILQPREEVNPSGAGDIVRSGLLDEAQIRAMIGAHVQPQVTRGIVSTGAGPVNAAFDTFEITVSGSGGHGAYPHTAVDPITCLCAIVTGLAGLRTRTVNPTHPAVLSVGTIAGGTASNVISEKAVVTGTMRTFHEEDRANLQTAITRLAEGTALSHGASAAVKFTRGGPALVNDAALVHHADQQFARLGISTASEPFRSCGSDDFAEYGQIVPSLMAFIGTGQAAGVGLHHAQFLPDRDALRLTAVAMAIGYVAAIELLSLDQ